MKSWIDIARYRCLDRQNFGSMSVVVHGYGVGENHTNILIPHHHSTKAHHCSKQAEVELHAERSLIHQGE